MSKEVKIIGVRRREIDADKLAVAFIVMAEKRLRERRAQQENDQ